MRRLEGNLEKEDSNAQERVDQAQKRAEEAAAKEEAARERADEAEERARHARKREEDAEERAQHLRISLEQTLRMHGDALASIAVAGSDKLVAVMQVVRRTLM